MGRAWRKACRSRSEYRQAPYTERAPEPGVVHRRSFQRRWRLSGRRARAHSAVLDHDGGRTLRPEIQAGLFGSIEMGARQGWAALRLEERIGRLLPLWTAKNRRLLRYGAVEATP